MRKLWVFLLAVSLAGCASNVYVPYPYPEESVETGRVIVRLSESMESVTVMIDGSIVAEDKHTARVEIQDVPVGDRDIQIIASEQWRTHSVNHEEIVQVRPQRDATVLIETPPYSSGYWAFRAVVWLVAFAPTLLIL